MVPQTYQQTYRKELQNYKKQFRHFLLTSRFNNHTWSENRHYRDASNSKIGCIYCSPDGISQSIPMDAIMFILEMNNDNNTIMGIGMVRNHPSNKKHQVYNDGNYNRFVYVGQTRIDREDMTKEEDEIMQAFDILCFTGNRHMKRGQGLKSFPSDMLYRCRPRIDLVEFIRNMFKKRLEKGEP